MKLSPNARGKTRSKLMLGLLMQNRGEKGTRYKEATNISPSVMEVKTRMIQTTRVERSIKK